MIKNHNFICKYCNKTFVHEKNYLNHRCKQLVRHEILETIEGGVAWGLYKDWFILKKRRPPDDPKAFLTSHYFKSFVRFSIYIRKIKLPDVKKFIQLMVKLDFPPTMWIKDEVYRKYIDSLSYKKLVNISLNTLYNLSEEYECDISDVFNHLTGSEVIELIREYKLTPWLLLRSKKFMIFLKRLKNKNKEEYAIIETLVDPDIWYERISKHKNFVKWIEQIINELCL